MGLRTDACPPIPDSDMTFRSLAALALLMAAPAAFAAGPQSVPSWASPSASAVAPAGQASNFGPGGPPPPPPPPPPVPLDGGLTLLAVAGAGYATKKLRARRAA